MIMGKSDTFRFAYDPVATLNNCPQLLGMELEWRGNDRLQGGYYLNGEKHPWRKDKLKCFISRGTVWVMEEGGRCVSIIQWLIEFGGAIDYKDALRMIKGESQALHWSREVRQSRMVECQYVSPDILAGARQYDLRLSPLFVWLCKFYPEERVREVFEKYNVTATSKHQTVFWYMDCDGHICHDKRIYYNYDGHRNKELPMGREYRVGNGYTAKTLFGAHLIPDSGEIRCLESEKSALICAIEYPNECWVACGGKSNLRGISERFVLYPDLDAVSDWNGAGGRIEEWWLDWRLPAEKRPQNADFADKIIWDKLCAFGK